MTTLTLNTSLLSSRRILAAFSGGLDSTVLLHQLVLWRERHPDVTLRAIHIHHGLSPHADSWVRHCETVCERWQVPLVVKRVTLADNGLVSRPMRVKRATGRSHRHYCLAKCWQPRSTLTISVKHSCWR